MFFTFYGNNNDSAENKPFSQADHHVFNACCCPASPHCGENIFSAPTDRLLSELSSSLFFLFSLSFFFYLAHYYFCLSPSSALFFVHSHSPRLLEHQLQTQRRGYDNEVEALRGELQNVKEENNRQQQLLAQNLQLPPEARIEASLQHEITRLTNENLVG